MEYFWIKFIHYCAFISWMAMLFYLPRLFVYHKEHEENLKFCEVVKIQESKLYHGIGWIAMGVSLLSGIYLIYLKPTLLMMPYFHLKLTCVILLIAYHFSLGWFMKRLKNDSCNRSGKFFRAYNEVPTLIMFGVIYAMIVWANS